MAVEVDVWSVGLDARAPSTSAVLDVLGVEERARAAGMRGSRRREFVLCRSVVRSLLADGASVPPSAVRWDVGEHGKPGPVGGVHWNLTHATGRALVATCSSVPVGVDLLRVDAVRATDLVRRFGTAAERVALAESAAGDRDAVAGRFLVRREACVKALGGRLLDLLHLDVTEVDGRRRVGGGPALTDLPAPPGWAAAVAAVARGPVRVHRHRWHWPT